MALKSSTCVNSKSELYDYVMQHRQFVWVAINPETGGDKVKLYQYDINSEEEDDGENIIKPTLVDGMVHDEEEYFGRHVKVDLSTLIPTQKRQEAYSGTTDSNGEYSVTFEDEYSIAPNIQANVIGGNSNQILTITSITATGFTVKVVEKSTTTLLGIVVVQNSTANVSGADIDVLITEK